jgi:hypothetical protein
MADPEFDAQLARMFAEHPPFPDQGVFAAKVEARLDRGWGVRRLVIGVLGLGGGVVAAGQGLGGNLLGRLLSASQASVNVAQHTASSAPDMLALLGQSWGLRIPSVGNEVIWLVLGLLAVAAALLATRALEDL